MRKYQIIPYTGLSINATFHTPAVNFGDWLTVKVSLSDLDDRLTVEPVDGGCEKVDTQHFRCVTGHTDGDESTSISFKVSAPAGMPAGPAGAISVWIDGGDQDPDQGNNTIRSTLDITNKAGSRVTVSTKSVSARIGQTVTMPIIGHNRGPNAIWALTVGNVDIPAGDLSFVGYTGCVGAWTSYYCASDYVRSGSSATIGLKIKVKRCGTNQASVPVAYRDGFSSRETVINWQFTVTVAVSGCVAPTPSPNPSVDAGGSTVRMTTSPGITATSSRLTFGSSSPEALVAADTSAQGQPIAFAANTSRTAISAWWIAALVLLVLGTIGSLTLWRRRIDPRSRL